MIAGFGQFARFERMPLWLAWEVFGEANGVTSERALVERLGRLARSSGRDLRRETAIGCIFVAFPVFFAPDDWIEPPNDWKANVVSGAGYDLSSGEGLRIWKECVARASQAKREPNWDPDAITTDRFGAPISVLPRLGQRSFRMAVLDAYGAVPARSRPSIRYRCSMPRTSSLTVMEVGTPSRTGCRCAKTCIGSSTLGS